MAQGTLFIKTLLVVFSVVTHATPFERQTIENYSKRLAEILKKNIKVLDRDMVTFHYQRPSSSGWQPKSVLDIENYLLSTPPRFFDINFSENSQEGPGLYVANDPASSRQFGGQTSDPQLYVLTIKKGAVILNTSNSAVSQSDRAEVKKMALELGCLSQAGGYAAELRNADSKVCRSIAINAYSLIGVQAVLYGYLGADNLTGCRQERDQALNIISSEIIRSKELNWYGKNNQVEGMPMAGFIRRLYKEGIVAQNLAWIQAMFPNMEMPFTLSFATASDQDYSEFKHTKIFKCGPTWSLE